MFSRRIRRLRKSKDSEGDVPLEGFFAPEPQAEHKKEPSKRSRMFGLLKEATSLSGHSRSDPHQTSSNDGSNGNNPNGNHANAHHSSDAPDLSPAVDKSTTEHTSVASARSPEEIVLQRFPQHFIKQNSIRTKQTVGTSGTGSMPSQSFHSHRKAQSRRTANRTAGKGWVSSVFIVNPDDEQSMSTFDPQGPEARRRVFRLPDDHDVLQQARLQNQNSVRSKVRRRASMGATSITKTPWHSNLFTVDCGAGGVVDDTDDRSDDHVDIVAANSKNPQAYLQSPGGRSLPTLSSPEKTLRPAPVLESLLEHVTTAPLEGPSPHRIATDHNSVASASTCSALTMSDPTMIKLHSKNGFLRKDLLIAMEDGKPVMKKQPETKFVKPRFIAFKARSPDKPVPNAYQ